MAHIGQHHQTHDLYADTLHFHDNNSNEVGLRADICKDLHLKFNLIQFKH